MKTRLTFMKLSDGTLVSKNTYKISEAPLPIRVHIKPAENLFLIETIQGNVLDEGRAGSLFQLRCAAKAKLLSMGVLFKEEGKRSKKNG